MIDAHPLAKSAALAFDAAQHPRAADGRFSSATGAGSPAAPRGQVVPFVQRRSLERSTSAWRIGARTPELPIEYTGSRQRELPVGSFLQADFKEQIPKSISVQEHQAVRRGLTTTINALREPIVASGQVPKRKGKLRGTILIPEGTEKRTIHRAYNHAAALATHAFGVGTYNFRMDDTLKAEMTPMVPFIRYAKRRLMDTMLVTQKGRWQPYREEFGQPFADQRRDKVTGKVRLRVPPNDQLIKAYDESKHPRSADGRFGSGGGKDAGDYAEDLAGAVVGHDELLGRFARRLRLGRGHLVRLARAATS